MSISPVQPNTPLANKAQFTYKAEVTTTSVEVNLSFKDQPLSLHYQLTIEKLNEQLSIDLGPYAIEKAADSGMDFSPEAVADRIVSFATGFYSAFTAKNDDLSTDDQLSEFMSIIRGAVEEGFNQAKDILVGMEVFTGDIEANANKTLDLIEEGFDSFERNILDMVETNKLEE